MANIPSSGKPPKIRPPENDFQIYLTAIVGGIAVATLGSDMQVIGYSVAAIGGVTTLFELRRLLNPYRALFENAGIKVGEQVPRFVKKRKTNYGYCITFSLPYGLSSEDFEKKKLAIEKYLNKRVEISYSNYRVFVKVFERNLNKSPKYEYQDSTKILEIPIGISYSGVVKIDLQDIVHLLIGGETGSGKSTLLRSIITTLILKDNVTLHLIDLKNGAEFNVFRKCKQVKTFSRNIEAAEYVLYDLTEEVERRYDLFYKNDVVDIKEYNKLKGVKKLNYQVIVIDEFADLQDEKGSISSIERLTQKARAAGIHCILATQRPDSKILNGRIKSNIPGTIGLKTINELNSRIIINQNGLENLRGQGHGLYRHSDLIEFQSYYISIDEARGFIKKYYIDKNPSKKAIEEPKNIGVVDNLSIIKGLMR